MMDIQFSSEDPRLGVPAMAQVGGRTLRLTNRRQYTSRVQFTATTTGVTGGQVHTLPANIERKAFAYKIGDTNPEGLTWPATPADTNLVNDARQTNDGDLLVIRGFGIEVLPRTDAALLKAAIGEITITPERGGERSVSVGLIQDFPAARGLFGGQTSMTQPRPIAGGEPPPAGSISNGVPGIQNERFFHDPFIWAPVGAGLSAFALILKTERAVVVNSTAATQTAAAGVHAWAIPTDGSILLDLRVHIFGEVYSQAVKD